MYHRFEENKYPSTSIKIDDFKNEIDGYLRIDQMAKGLHKLKLKPGLFNISYNLIKCYEFLVKDGFVLKSELSLINSWILDIKKIDQNNLN